MCVDSIDGPGPCLALDLSLTVCIGPVLHLLVLAVLLNGQDCQQHAQKLAKPKLHLLLLYPQEQMFSSQTCQYACSLHACHENSGYTLSRRAVERL